MIAITEIGIRLNEDLRKDSKLRYYRSRLDIHQEQGKKNNFLYDKFESIIVEADRFRTAILSKKYDKES
jgi:hypothetical protein